MPLTTNTVESSNIRQQKNSSSNTFLHSLTVALNLTIQEDKIILYFSNIIDNKNFWCYEDIFYFGLITQLLDARHLHGFSLKLLEYIEKNPIDSKVWNELAINALLNADFSLMKKDLKKAEELYNRLDILEAIDNYAELIIRKKFLESLIQYLKNNSNVEIFFYFVA